ncbi:MULTISPECIES: gamma carbonic anhydrase family protein [Anaerostipes]|uniref:gamma carbonic anhydrase family protein n=1 Tax=Anaerostipes TaxID=207244 RepID=UPI00095210B7|nr:MULTISPECIES: gamma carbonic anhydrase family protein [Anaerostipes]MCI5622365.1 gamma carbonic anhydrase family protein [Anaerostipes sp.]MDY2727265.1 gamma carbonic anhydrase family protein [Anaerostipes faecalis]OLR59154.1 gamma carbonic anhydrase family protein [Anaerostipes sp. 494a]
MNYKKAKISETASVAKETILLGDITIGDETTVLFYTVMRAEDPQTIEIGRQSNIQENCTIHVDEGFGVKIGDGVTVGHNCVIHGCEIGDGTLIGMGSIIMNGAKVGKGCLIGAGSLITQNTVIPDGMLVMGSPAKVKRPLTEEEKQYIADSVPEYIEAGKMLREDGIL